MPDTLLKFGFALRDEGHFLNAMEKFQEISTYTSKESYLTRADTAIEGQRSQNWQKMRVRMAYLCTLKRKRKPAKERRWIMRLWIFSLKSRGLFFPVKVDIEALFPKI